MLVPEAEIAYVVTLITLDRERSDQRRSVTWRGFIFEETCKGASRPYMTGVVARDKTGHTALVGSLASAWVPVPDYWWVRNVLTWIAEHGFKMRHLVSYDRVPWVVHAIRGFEAYLTALNEFTSTARSL